MPHKLWHRPVTQEERSEGSEVQSRLQLQGGVQGHPGPEDSASKDNVGPKHIARSQENIALKLIMLYIINVLYIINKLPLKRKVRAGKTPQQVKAPVHHPEIVSSIPGTTRWKEKNDSPICPLSRGP